MVGMMYDGGYKCKLLSRAVVKLNLINLGVEKYGISIYTPFQ
jgi:hypothetical protein